MKTSQVAIQLYTLRNFCKTAEDYAATLKKVRAIGYEAAQISGVGPIPATELRSIADAEGIIICATHEPGKMILDEPEKVVERLETLGVKYTAYPNPGGIDLDNPAEVERMITGLDRAGAVLKKAGKVLCYHNHATEFNKRIDGRPLLEIIYERTNPEHLLGEPDTAWVHAGGSCPVDWCRRLKNRMPLIHLKDYKRDAEGNPVTMEIGNGILDFKPIVDAAEASGCEWYIVEQDRCGDNDPFDSVRQSFEYIQANLVK